MAKVRPLKISPTLIDLPSIRLSKVEDLQGNLKDLSKTDFDKLKSRLGKVGFKYPLYLWNHDGKFFNLDGNQRKRVIMSVWGDIELPYIEVEAGSEKEARMEIMAISSQYGKVTKEGFDEFTWDFEEGDFSDIIQGTTFDEWLDLEEKEEDDNPIDEKNVWVPDCLYPSNNIYEIPTLIPEMQGEVLHLPFEAWGEKSRLRKDVGTYHFYVDDYRFSAIWDNPEKIIQANVQAIVEPNLSLFDTTPVSYGLHLIYKKRWISRFLQDHQIRVFMDLNVSAKFYEYNTLGVPEGWNAFCTRGYARRIQYLEKELHIARQISGLENPNMVVYGGGMKIRSFCADYNLIYTENLMTRKNGEDIRGS